MGVANTSRFTVNNFARLISSLKIDTEYEPLNLLTADFRPFEGEKSSFLETLNATCLSSELFVSWRVDGDVSIDVRLKVKRDVD